MQVRTATEADGAACAAVYAPYVTDTVITFELEPPSAEDFAARIATANERHAWLVLEDDGRVVGYAYGGTYLPRAAYRWACEVSVYLELGRRRTGAGRMLYEALLHRLTERGFLTFIAGMTLPNPASEGLHRAHGLRARRHLPPHRLQVRRLARRRLDAARPPRPGRAARAYIKGQAL